MNSNYDDIAANKKRVDFWIKTKKIFLIKYVMSCNL